MKLKACHNYRSLQSKNFRDSSCIISDSMSMANSNIVRFATVPRHASVNLVLKNSERSIYIICTIPILSGWTCGNSKRFSVILANICCSFFRLHYEITSGRYQLNFSDFPMFFISNFSIAIVGTYVSGRPTSHSPHARMTGKPFYVVDGNIASCFTIKRQNVCY